MTEPGSDRAEMEARNAAIKAQVDGLLEKFEQQTRTLQEAQAAASTASATVTSPDGSVTVTVDSAGTMTNLEFSAKSFQRSDPRVVARTVQETLQAATVQVKSQMADLLSPVTQDLPDLSDLIDGAPSLKGLMPKMPDFSESPKAPEPLASQASPSPSAAPASPGADQPEPKPTQPQRARRQQADDDPEFDEPDSWLR